MKMTDALAIPMLGMLTMRTFIKMRCKCWRVNEMQVLVVEQQNKRLPRDFPFTAMTTTNEGDTTGAPFEIYQDPTRKRRRYGNLFRSCKCSPDFVSCSCGSRWL